MPKANTAFAEGKKRFRKCGKHVTKKGANAPFFLIQPLQLLFLFC